MKRLLIESTKTALRKLNLPVGYGQAPGALEHQEASDRIREALLDSKPLFLARYGWTELNAIIAYTAGIDHGVKYGSLVRAALRHLVNHRRLMMQSSGFFSNDPGNVRRFCRYQMDIMGDIDLCASWMKQERFVMKYMTNTVWVSGRSLLNPYVGKPWTDVLQGRRVLVVNQFTNSIERQYAEKRQLLFDKKDYLPEFQLSTYKPVQVVNKTDSAYASWWEALEKMKGDIAAKEFDIALLSCGAYGHPLCAHIKALGKKAVYMGGELQLLFGVYGDRWAGNPLINEHWIRPLKEDLPNAASNTAYDALKNYV